MLRKDFWIYQKSTLSRLFCIEFALFILTLDLAMRFLVTVVNIQILHLYRFRDIYFFKYISTKIGKLILLCLTISKLLFVNLCNSYFSFHIGIDIRCM